ncbi:unnamed protein product [Microthlaspi erraticum]|uniref:Uncharacterized protein n=1 Tax=Microthlaspi erraticum TaxID=1685480 RepID=A0A6D2JPY0_9BRAS|nr:unnamed protein product [Microthlaspi erraticum]
MDFIKTSSLRALIELTFQRNWNGFIWMSRKGVIAKRVKAAPDGYIENQRRTRRPAGRGTNVPRSAKTVSVRLKSRPKSNHSADHTARPGKHCPRSATPRHAAHDQPREPGNASRPRNSLAYHGRCIRPSRENVPRPAEKPSAKFHPRPQPADRSSGPTVPTRPRPDCPADRPDDRPNAAVDPKPFLKPNPHNSSPKPAPT